MTQLYEGPDKLFVIPYPDDWTYVRRPRGEGELDHVTFHRAAGSVGALHVTALRAVDEQGAVAKMIARLMELYRRPVPPETEVREIIRGKMGTKDGFVRVSFASERGIPQMVVMMVYGGGRTVIVANFVEPLVGVDQAAAKAERAAATRMIEGATLS